MGRKGRGKGRKAKRDGGKERGEGRPLDLLTPEKFPIYATGFHSLMIDGKDMVIVMIMMTMFAQITECYSKSPE